MGWLRELIFEIVGAAADARLGYALCVALPVGLAILPSGGES